MRAISAKRAMGWTLVLSVLAGGCASKPTATSTPAEQPTAAAAVLTPEAQARNLESFDYIWSTIKEQHWDANAVGESWDAARTQFRAKVEAATTMDEARGAMNGLIGTLGQSHFGVLPADAYNDAAAKSAAESTAGASGAGGGESASASEGLNDGDQPKADRPPMLGVTGMRIWPVGDQALVTRVDPGSPADVVGVRSGWVLSKVGQRDVGKMIARMREAMPGKTSADLVIWSSLTSMIEGEPGDVLTVEFLDASDRPARRSMGLVRSSAKPAKFGNLPPMWLTHERRRIDDRVGYFAFSLFFEPMLIAAEMQAAVEDARGLDGLIIDLRGNIGGIGAMAMGIGGWLIDKPRQNLGVMTTKQTKLTFVLNPRAEPYNKPVAVLIDGASASTSEILAGGLKDLKRARLFGQLTAGAALPSRIERLPNGDGFQYAFADYVTTSGARLEGVGVQPDEVIVPDRASLLAGRDPVLDAAVRWIRGQAAGQ